MNTNSSKMEVASEPTELEIAKTQIELMTIKISLLNKILAVNENMIDNYKQKVLDVEKTLILQMHQSEK